MEDINNPIKVMGAPKKNKTFLLWLFVFLTVGFAGATFYYAKENYDLKKNPDKLTEDENKDLIKRVEKFMVLPKDEEPTIATVTDLSVLKDQPFFDKAQIGDKVLIYSVAKKAILFNPTENKVVEVAPINDQPVNTTNTNVDTNTEKETEIKTKK